MKIVTLTIAVILLVAANPWNLMAQEPDPKAPEGSMPRILADIAAARKESEKKLERAFQDAIKAIEKSDTVSRGRAEMVVNNLKASQAAWQAFRHKQCDFLYGYYYKEIGSTGARAAGIWEYENRLIKQRIKELNEPPGDF